MKQKEIVLMFTVWFWEINGREWGSKKRKKGETDFLSVIVLALVFFWGVYENSSWSCWYVPEQKRVLNENSIQTMLDTYLPLWWGSKEMWSDVKVQTLINHQPSAFGISSSW